MPKRYHRMCLIIAIMAFLWSACGNDEFNKPTIFGGTGSDAGNTSDTATPDVVSDVAPHQPDPRCEGLQPGATCELTNASGVCVEGKCQFLSCITGFRSCDDDLDNGCETDVTQDANCGVCGTSCSAPESCQLSRVGWVCSVSPVCPESTYDLDGDTENGCEWSATWAADGVLDPTSLRPDTALELDSGTFAVVGRTADARLVTTTDPTQAPEGLPLPIDTSDPARARSAIELAGPNDNRLVAVAWNDAITLSSASGSTTSDAVFEYVCEGGTGSSTREFIAVAGSEDSPIFAATSHEVLQLDRDCGAGGELCGEPSFAFTQNDYLAAFESNTDASICGGCDPNPFNCPTFAPIGARYLADSGTLVVFTERGFVLLTSTTSGFVAGPRLEQPNEDGIERYSAGTAVEQGATTRVYLLAESGTLRQFVVDGTDISPAGPGIGLSADADDATRLVTGPNGVLLVSDARRAWLVHPLDRSARIETLAEPEVFFGDGQIIFGTGFATSPVDEYSLLYFGVGRYYLRHVTN